jgi:hypothetical protein
MSLLAHPSHFDLEDGGSMYLRNVSNASHIQTVQRPKSRINILIVFKTTCQLYMHDMWCTVMHNIKVDIISNRNHIAQLGHYFCWCDRIGVVPTSRTGWVWWTDWCMIAGIEVFHKSVASRISRICSDHCLFPQLPRLISEGLLVVIRTQS